MDGVRYISLFSGVEAAKLAFDKAGINATPLAFSEIERKQCELLAAKYPGVTNDPERCCVWCRHCKVDENWIVHCEPAFITESIYVCNSFKLKSQP